MPRRRVRRQLWIPRLNLYTRSDIVSWPSDKPWNLARCELDLLRDTTRYVRETGCNSTTYKRDRPPRLKRSAKIFPRARRKCIRKMQKYVSNCVFLRANRGRVSYKRLFRSIIFCLWFIISVNFKGLIFFGKIDSFDTTRNDWQWNSGNEF